MLRFFSLTSVTFLLTLASFLLLTTSISSCGEDVTTRFSQHRAFLRFSPVAAAPPLSAALNGLGEWCSITFDAQRYTFANAAGRTSQYPRTALDAYGAPLAISGFVVGTPALPDLNGRQSVVTFDLVCPSCYEAARIERRLSWQSSAPGTMVCGRCHREYDLNNGGIVSKTQSDEQPNVALFRYSAQYAADNGTFVVQN